MLISVSELTKDESILLYLRDNAAMVPNRTLQNGRRQDNDVAVLESRWYF